MTQSQQHEHSAPGREIPGLDALVARITARDDVSAARARQLRWVAGELRLAVNHPDFPDPPAGQGPEQEISELLSSASVGAYLRLADSGKLRRRAATGKSGASDSSMRVRVMCLELMAQAALVPLEIEGRPNTPPLREVVDAPTRSQLRAWLEDRSNKPGGPPGRARLLAIIGVVLDTGARVGELCALRLDDLAADMSTLRIVRHPQARRQAEPQPEEVPLTAGTRGAMAAWLEVREELVQPVTGQKTALWVSVRGNHSGTLAPGGGVRRRPPGMPLQPRGLQRAYTRAVVELNTELVGSPGWRPIPYRLEQLRRAVEVTAPGV